MKKIMLVALAVVLLSGCTGGKNKVLACNQSSGDVSSTANFNFVGDALSTIVIDGSIPIPAAETDEQQEEMMNLIKGTQEEIVTQLKEVEGITYEYALTEAEMTQKMQIEIAKISDEMALSFGFTDDMKKDGKFNIDKIQEYYKNLGVECTRK